MLEDFFGHGDYQADFGMMSRGLRSILEQFKLSLSEEELGLGSQNLLFIAAELLNLQRESWTGLRLALVEELEAHLHPQAQMRVIEYLQNEARGKQSSPEDGTVDQPNTDGTDTKSNSEARGKPPDDTHFQVILTTHSPNLGSKVKLKNLIICQGSHVFPMGTQYTQLKEPDYAFLERFLDVTKANLFFAKGVILVEGPSEELILPVLAKKAGCDLTRAGVSIINVSNTAFLRYAGVFLRKSDQAMHVRVAVVTDLDIKPDEYTVVDATKNTEKDHDLPSEIGKKKNKYTGQCVETFVSPHWTLEYCLARSPGLAPLLYEAVKNAITEMRDDGKSLAQLSESYEEFSKDKSPEQIAFDLYKELILDKDVRKPIVAQHFATVVEKSSVTKGDLLEADSTKYLMDAIKYVTSKNSNH